MKRTAAALTASLFALGLVGCAGIVDPNAELDPEVMEDPWMNEARDNTTPSGVLGD